MKRIFVLFFVVVISGVAACGDETTTSGTSSSGGDSGSGGEVSAEVAEVEARTFQLVNQERQDGGLSALTRSSQLDVVARAHSQDMLDRDFFSHTNPDEEDPGDRLSAAGISGSAYAENIGYVYGYSDPGATAVEGWMDSSGHRANILDESNHGHTQTGVGVAVDSEGTYYYFTQLFFKP